MAQTMSKRDILHIAASGEAAKQMHEFLKNLCIDVTNAIAGITTIFHRNQDDGSTVLSANASDLATAITLVNEEKAKVNTHLASVVNLGAHLAASAASIAAADATDQATAITLANEIKADYNTHRTESGVHLNNDTTNAVSSADATDLATLQTLVNEIKTDYNAHIASKMSVPPIED